MNQPGLVLSRPSYLSHPYVHSLGASFSPFVTPPFLTFFLTFCCERSAPFSLTFFRPALLGSPSCYTLSPSVLRCSFLWFLPLFLSSLRQLPPLHPSPPWLSSPFFFYFLWLIPTFFFFSNLSPVLSHPLICDRSSVFICSSCFNIFQKILHFTLTSPLRSPGAHPYPQFSCSHSVTHISITVLCVLPPLYAHISHRSSPSISLGKGLLKCTAG